MAPFMWKGAGHAWLQRRVQEPMLVPSLTKTISRPSPGMPRSLTETHAPWKQMFTHLHASLPPPASYWEGLCHSLPPGHWLWQVQRPFSLEQGQGSTRHYHSF